MTRKLLTLILALVFFTACEQLTGKKDDPARAIQRIPDPIPVPQPPPPLPHPAPPPPIVVTKPTLSFGFDEFSHTGATNQLILELYLSQPSELTISVDIILADGTALYPKDYIGFDGSSANDLRITVEIPPNTTSIQVPPLLFPTEGNCNVEFTARLNKDTVQNADLVKETSTIKVPCM